MNKIDPSGLQWVNIATALSNFLRALTGFQESVNVSANDSGGGFGLGGSIEIEEDIDFEAPVSDFQGLPAGFDVLPSAQLSALWGAFLELLDYLFEDIGEACLEAVFNKLEVDHMSFLQYLSVGALFLDGTRSNAPIIPTLTNNRGIRREKYSNCRTVSCYFRRQRGVNAVTVSTFDNPGLIVFVRPGNNANGDPVVDLSQGGINGRNLSLIVHEALHAFGGNSRNQIFDDDLKKAFGVNCEGSDCVTQYIQENCFWEYD